MTEEPFVVGQRQTHRGVGIKQWRLVARNLPFSVSFDEIFGCDEHFGKFLDILRNFCERLGTEK